MQCNTLDYGRAAFRTTRWSMVLEATRGEDPDAARAALEHLCAAYWFPLYAFVRRKGCSAEDSQDLVQSFFAHLLEKNVLHSVERVKGKFRTFLLASISHHLANERDKRSRLKRGGGCQIVSIDANEAEDRYQRAPADAGETPDLAFDRAWAQTVFDEVMARLREECRANGDGERFELLKPCLMGEEAAGGYAAAGARLGLSENGVKTSVHRLRLRFRELLREVLADTLVNRGDLENEVRHMIASLR